MKRKKLHIELNPRFDRFENIVKKIAKETENALIKFGDHSPEWVKNKVQEVFFQKTEGGEDVDSVEGTCARYKNNNLYAFMIDEVSLARVVNLLDQNGVFVNNYGQYFTLNKDKFPYINSIIQKRKFQQLAEYKNGLENQSIFDIADHIDDMLQMPAIAALVRADVGMPPTTMTLEDFHKLRISIQQIEAKFDKPIDNSKGLKEVSWASIKDKSFNSPLTDKRPPYQGVIPSGATFIEGDNFKWVDLSYSSNVYEFARKSNENRLNAPYESFYVRHCGRDYGNRLLSLRVKMGDGWYPIAMATLNIRDGAYNLFQITQLKTYANNTYWSLDSQAFSWLKARGLHLSRDEMKVNPDDDLYRMVKALILSPEVSSILDDHDLNMATFKNDEEVMAKMKKEIHEYIFYKDRSNKIPPIGLVHELLQRDDRQIVAIQNFPDLEKYLEGMALNHFIALIKIHFPEYQGEVTISVSGAYLSNTKKQVFYTTLIGKFGHLYDAENFYWDRFPNQREEHEVGSGERIRYSGNSYHSYIERIIYGSSSEVSLRAYFNFSAIAVHNVEEMMVDSIKIFARRWKTYFEGAKKNPDCRKAGMSAKERSAYNKKHGSNVQKGVTNIDSMEKLRRWGAWATRFYGRSDRPSLVKNGKLTPLSCTSLAWGRKAPKTWTEAKKIYRDGKDALSLYKKLRENYSDSKKFSKAETAKLNRRYLEKIK